MASIDHLRDQPQSLRQAQQQLTRSRLLDAGARLILEQGYAHVKVAEIAIAAGVSRATFYLHFPSKAELAAALDHVDLDFDPELEALLALVREPSPAAIAAWLADYAEELSGRLHHAAALREAWRADPHVRTQMDARLQEIAGQMAGELQAARGWPAARARMVSRLMLRDLDLFDDEPPAVWAHTREALSTVWLALLTG